MKFLLFLITPVFCDILNMVKLLDNITSTQTTSNRNFLNPHTDASSWIDMIMSQGYGCWCYFFEYSLQNGKGQPKDNLDRACKALHDGYHCIIQDSLTENQNCQNPWNTVYNGYAQFSSQIYQDCEAQNPNDWCKIRACAVESNSIHNLLSEINGSPGNVPVVTNLPNQNLYGHTNGFQPEIDCIRSGSGAGSSQTRQCCGLYPNRNIC